MTQPHPDSQRLAALIDDHEQADVSSSDPAGKIAGYDSRALLGAADYRAHLMLEGHGTLLTFSQEQTDELRPLLATMWSDGFEVGVRSQQSDA